MYYTEDENFAIQLQKELQAYENFKQQKENKEKENLKPIDTKLEFIDPTPNIHDLFVNFDKKFFWNTLGMVEVVWSNKMTMCAGVCSFEGGRGLCKIALSAPLLSLRPRKDLVETLLHEMIHAYLFVTHSYKDREDHGPEFHKHMFRINKEAGTNISVYHTFFDEVEYYQRHIWRCDGPCQKKKPYFGFVRRAVNRPPGPKDSWWNKHQMECGGTYTKISEPEKKPKKRRKITVVKPDEKTKDIRDYFGKNKILPKNTQTGQVSNIKTLADIKGSSVSGLKTNSGTGTLVVTNKNKEKKSRSPKNQNPRGKPIQNKNVQPTLVELVRNSGGNLKMSEDSKKGSEKTKDPDNNKVRETVRNFWANKFSNSNPTSPKKLKLKCSNCNEGFSEEELKNHEYECMRNNGKEEKIKGNEEVTEVTAAETSKCDKTDNNYKKCPVCNVSVLKLEMNDHLENCLSECSFVSEEDDKDENEITCESFPCPCCYKWFQESEMNCHIDECLTLNTLKEEILAS